MIELEPNSNECAQVDLRLVATTDLHAQLFAYDYVRDAETKPKGLLALRETIARLRKETPTLVLLDNGDLLQGDILGTYAAQGDLDIHPMIEALNDLAFDAAGLGNHDFDFGLEFAVLAYEKATFPIVCSNLTLTNIARCPFKQMHIIERTLFDQNGVPHQIKVGVIGLLPERTMLWNEAQLFDRASVADWKVTAAQYARMARTMGADIVVGLAHSGLGPSGPTNAEDNFSRQLLELSQIDAVIAGHDHKMFPNTTAPAANFALVQPGSGGAALGQIDLCLEKKDGIWRVRDAQAKLVNPDPKQGHDHMRTDPALRALHDRVWQFANEPVGFLGAPIERASSLRRTSSAALFLDAAMRWFVENELGNDILGGLPLLVATSPIQSGLDRPDIASGKIFRKDLIDLCPFQNKFTLVEVDGALLTKWLKRSARAYEQVAKNDISSINGPNFDCFVDVSFDYKVRKTKPNIELNDIRVFGEPLRRGDRFVVATSHFRASGGGDYPLESARHLLALDVEMRDILENFISRNPGYMTVPRSLSSGPQDAPMVAQT